MNPHFFTAPFFCFHLVQGSGGGFAAFLEDGILVLSEQIHAYVEKE